MLLLNALNQPIEQWTSQKIELVQNTWAWFQHRKNYINASEIGTIMGLNPYETREVLIKKKIFGSPPFPESARLAVEHGRITEPQANLFFSIEKQRNYEPTVFTKGFFSSSLDGWHKESSTILEIKCPMKKNAPSWAEFFKKGIIPPYYWAQIQCGLFCSESKKAYFLVYFNDNDFVVKEVELDKEFIKEMIIKCREYNQLLVSYQAKMPAKK